MRSGMRLLLLAALSLTLAARVAAQDGHKHRGFWIGYGLGGGPSLDYLADGETFNGAGGYLRLGGTPSQKVLLGLETMAWGRDLNGSLLGHGRASFVMQFYTSRHSGFFLKGGLGVGGNIIPDAFPGCCSDDGFAHSAPPVTFASTFGIGGDVQLGNNIYLTPNVDFMFQSWESEFDPVVATGMSSILLFTLGLTWH